MNANNFISKYLCYLLNFISKKIYKYIKFIDVHMYENETDTFEESIHIFHKSLEEMLNHFDSKYSMIDNEDPNSFISKYLFI